MKRHRDNRNTFNTSGEAVFPAETDSIELSQSPEAVTHARHQAFEEEVAYRRAEERGFALSGDNGRMAWCRG
jgi:hypothetical protein